MATSVEISKEFTYRVAAKIQAGENMVKEISMAAPSRRFATVSAVRRFKYTAATGTW